MTCSSSVTSPCSCQTRQEMAGQTFVGHLEPKEYTKSSHGFTPFFLVYGAEAILPTDLEYGSPRLQAYNEQSNRTTREDALDQLEEARDVALLHSAKYQQALRRYQARCI